MPETMSVERRKLLAALGAEVVLTPGAEGGMGGSGRPCGPDRRREPGHLLRAPQFENPANPRRSPSDDGRGDLAGYRRDRRRRRRRRRGRAERSPGGRGGHQARNPLLQGVRRRARRVPPGPLRRGRPDRTVSRGGSGGPDSCRASCGPISSTRSSGSPPRTLRDEPPARP